MKITPIEIRQKTFEKNFRGYDKDEVDGYLQSLSQEWEKLMDENKELSIKLRSSEREVEKLREVENSLFKTLKTAEDTGANIMDQATKAADLHVREAELKAEAILNDARNKAHNTIEEAENLAREAYDEMETEVKALAKLYQTLENLKDDLLSGIKSVTADVTEKMNRAQNQIKRFDVDHHLMEIRKNAVTAPSNKRKKLEAKTTDTIALPENMDTEEQKETKKEKENNIAQKPKEKEEKQAQGTDRSFFDEIE